VAWEQPSWPQVHMISVLSEMPSQWALQYFCLSGAVQLQAGFAHFFVAAMFTSEIGPARGIKRPRHGRFGCG
jgi:hypothetical protein